MRKEFLESGEILMSLINDVIKPCQSIEPTDGDQAAIKTVMDIIAVHVPKLLDEIERLRKTLKWYADVDNYGCYGESDLGEKARKTLGDNS